MLTRAAVRRVSLIRNSNLFGAAAVFAGTVAYPAAVSIQIAAGLVTFYTLCDRLDYVNFTLLIDYEKRQELLLTSLTNVLLKSSQFAGCDRRKLTFGYPGIKFADQGLLGEILRNLTDNKRRVLSGFYLDVNYIVNSGEKSGFLNCEGHFVKKTQFRFTKITGKEVIPSGKKFTIAVTKDWEKGE